MVTFSVAPSNKTTSSPLGFIWLEVTGTCNLSCTHCYAESGPHVTHGTMQQADWKRVITEVHEMGCQSVQFIGGEPTVYPHIVDLITFAHAKGIRIEVYTNLVAIKPALWDVFLACNVSIATSFYSLHPNVHELITQGKHSFEKTVHNIQRTLELGLPLRVGLIEMRGDQDIEQTVQFLKDLGVTHLRKDKTRSVGRGSDLVQVGCREDALCGACASGRAAITPNGDVFPCVFSRWLPLGNVKEQSFSTIMASKKTNDTRIQLKKRFDRRRSEQNTVYENCMPSTEPYMKTQDLTALLHPCDPLDDDDPNCEPNECNPDACPPSHLCVPDYKEDCNPTKPCPPDEEACPPDWDE